MSDNEETPEIFELIRDKFQTDLAKTFGERSKEFKTPLVNLLFEFWMAATHSEIKVKPPEEVMKIVRDHFTGARALSLNFEEELQKLYENGKNPLQDALQAKGVSESYLMVPMMMHKETGQVFGMDLGTNQKFIPTQRIVHLTNNNNGFQWDFDVSYQPPFHKDYDAKHIIIRVNGIVKMAPLDYTVATTCYGGDEAISSIYMTTACPGAQVTATYSDVTTDYL